MTELSGTWRVVEPSADWWGDGASLTFEGDGQLFGSSGINRVRGTYTCDDDLLTVGPLASTLMAGPEPLMAAEHDIQQLLGVPLHVTAPSDGELVLGADDGRTLRLERAAPTTRA